MNEELEITYIDPADLSIFQLGNIDSTINVNNRRIVYDEKVDHLVMTIQEKIDRIRYNRFEPKYILMNARNYERLVAFSVRHSGETIVENFMGLQVIVWDIPVDYINVIAGPNDEWIYGKAIRK